MNKISDQPVIANGDEIITLYTKPVAVNSAALASVIIT